MLNYYSLIVPIIAAAIGSFLGFIYQARSDKKREKKNLLAVIMAYRGLLSREDDFVKALNMIDIYYYDNKEVRRLYHDYLNHLVVPLFDTGQHSRILLDLILAMAKECGYNGLVEKDITHYYYPERYNLKDSSGTVTP